MRFVKVVVAVALAVVGVIAFDMQSGKGNDADAGPALAQQPDPTLSQLSVFRRGRDARDELPALAARSLAAQPAGSGQNPALSRAVQLPSGPRYLIPGNGVVGFFTAYGNGGVSAIADVLAGQVVASEMCLDVLRSGQLRVVGLLPDSASNRAIILRNGKRVDLTVTDNAYEMTFTPASAAELPAKVVFVNRGAAQEVPIPGADDEVLTSRCAGDP
jgi:hypothetical protein